MASSVMHSLQPILLLLIASSIICTTADTKFVLVGGGGGNTHEMFPVTRECFQTMVDILTDIFTYRVFGGNFEILRGRNYTDPVTVGFVMYSHPLRWDSGAPDEHSPSMKDYPFQWNSGIAGRSLHNSYSYVSLGWKPASFHNLFYILAHELGHSIGFKHVSSNFTMVMSPYFTDKDGVDAAGVFGKPGEVEEMLKRTYNGTLAQKFGKVGGTVPTLVMALMQRAFYRCKGVYDRRNPAALTTKYRAYNALAGVTENRLVVHFWDLNEILTFYKEVDLLPRNEAPRILKIGYSEERDVILLFLNINALTRPYFAMRGDGVRSYLSYCNSPPCYSLEYKEKGNDKVVDNNSTATYTAECGTWACSFGQSSDISEYEGMHGVDSVKTESGDRWITLAENGSMVAVHTPNAHVLLTVVDFVRDVCIHRSMECI